jgi:hypothetical protein
VPPHSVELVTIMAVGGRPARIPLQQRGRADYPVCSARDGTQIHLRDGSRLSGGSRAPDRTSVVSTQSASDVPRIREKKPQPTRRRVRNRVVVSCRSGRGDGAPHSCCSRYVRVTGRILNASTTSWRTPIAAAFTPRVLCPCRAVLRVVIGYDVRQTSADRGNCPLCQRPARRSPSRNQ